MSDTNGFRDDPRLTAYALGELEGDDAREVEALVTGNEDARRAVDEIRAAAAAVTAELAPTGAVTLTQEQRARIRAAIAPPRPPFRAPRVYRIRTVAAVAAASIVVGATSAIYFGSDDFRMFDTASTAGSGQRPQGDGSAVGVRMSPGTIRVPYSLEERGLKPSTSSPVNPAEVVAPGFRRLEDPSAAAVVPGATDGTSIVGGAGGGAESTGAYSIGGGGGGGGARTPSVARRVRADGLGYVGDDSPQQERRRMRGPAGEVPPDSRLPSDPPPPPEAGSPQTPGAPTTGGPDAGGPSTPGGVMVATATLEQLKRQQVSANTVGFLSRGSGEGSSESYAHIEDNPFRTAKDSPLSTFGVDVDTASYSNVRRMLTEGSVPPPGAVRIEEMVNYFPYDYAPPTDGRPFSVRVDVAGCPWKTDHRLVRIGLKGRVVATQERAAANLVFLLDVSGSMHPENRLPLVLQSMKALVERLEPRDRVAIVVYAGASGLALPSTSCSEKGTILAALDKLQAGGSTNGAAGIELAYQVAQQNRVDGGVNRVILATDGDFNVGVADESSLVKLIEEKRKGGVFLSVLGVGDDNYQDAKMEMLADRGNGNYAYLDSVKEGQKVLGEQVNATLVTIAKDVKVQVEFNPAQVGTWRLIGYEDRVLASEDFKDDRKDAGDIGAGHTVTALYEVVPSALGTQTAGVDPLRYQRPAEPSGALSHEMLTVKLRWKEPNSDVSTPMEMPVVDEGLTYSSASPDFKFAAAVAGFGMCLRNSPNKGDANLAAVLELATEGAANDPGGWRHEFVDLVKRAASLGVK